MASYSFNDSWFAKEWDSCKFPHLKIIASGGIRDINDIQKLISIKIEHAVIGKAIYEEKIELMELLNVN